MCRQRMHHDDRGHRVNVGWKREFAHEAEPIGGLQSDRFPPRGKYAVCADQCCRCLSHGFAVAMVGVLWSYGGWQHATFASAEVTDPRRTLPLAMTVGAATVTLLYLTTNLAYLFLLSPADMAAS